MGQQSIFNIFYNRFQCIIHSHISLSISTMNFYDCRFIACRRSTITQLISCELFKKIIIANLNCPDFTKLLVFFFDKYLQRQLNTEQ